MIKVRVQAVELEAFNQKLEGKVQEQLTKIQRMDGLKRFLPPQVAEIALTGDEETFLQQLKTAPSTYCGGVSRPDWIHRLRIVGRTGRFNADARGIQSGDG
ncbi:MAG: hypothetical protein CM1200mP41_20410 [Gammaproteobacteria bacterium]|nr:MAG: hypothetical protein CM1200mP41_20410 [Gammaproteobacteria bacterium]